MTSHAAFLADIIAAPQDDTPRLIYADWLEENGDSDRAEFIRTQCAIAAEESYPGDRWCAEAGGKLRVGVADCFRCRPCLLRRREKELLLGLNAAKWLEPFPDLLLGLDALIWQGSEQNTLVVGSYKRRLKNHIQASFAFRRGFIAEITLSCSDWLTHRERLLRAAPLERMTLTHLPPGTGLRPEDSFTLSKEQSWYAWNWYEEVGQHNLFVSLDDHHQNGLYHLRPIT